MKQIKWLLLAALLVPTFAVAGDLRWPGSHGHSWHGRDYGCEPQRPSYGYSRYDRGFGGDRWYGSPYSYGGHRYDRQWDRRGDDHRRWVYDQGRGRWGYYEPRADDRRWKQHRNRRSERKDDRHDDWKHRRSDRSYSWR